MKKLVVTVIGVCLFLVLAYGLLNGRDGEDGMKGSSADIVYGKAHGLPPSPVQIHKGEVSEAIEPVSTLELPKVEVADFENSILE